MLISVEYIGPFCIENLPRKSTLETAPETTIAELLKTLNVNKTAAKYLIIAVNRKRRNSAYRLKAGDEVLLHYPLGGG